MEEKGKERNKTSRIPKMKINEKCSNRGPKMMKKIVKNRSLGVGKSRKMGAGGAFQREQNTRFRKIADPSNSAAPFLSILVENGSQDGGQNPLKIEKKIDSKCEDFFDRFFDAFWDGFSCQNGRRIGAKTLSETCWNRS